MLMDEPFGAIDPINRERLQNEFLRLQQEIRKTIVFVTHDIDEAIKMGDRIAVLQQGGELAQYAPPAELLMYPADAVRGGLRGRRPRAQAPRAPARARHRPLEGAAGAGRRARERGAGQDRGLRPPLPAARRRRRHAGWLPERGLAGERVEGLAPSRSSSSTTCSATPCPTCSSTRPSTGRSWTRAGTVAGVLSVEVIGRSRPTPSRCRAAPTRLA